MNELLLALGVRTETVPSIVAVAAVGRVDEDGGGLVYWPQDTQLFSTTGCKRVANKLDLLEEAMEEEEI